MQDNHAEVDIHKWEHQEYMKTSILLIKNFVFNKSLKRNYDIPRLKQVVLGTSHLFVDKANAQAEKLEGEELSNVR